MSEVATVIVNYRTPALVVDCLRSVAPPAERLGPVIVVDNGSGDGSATRLAEAVRAEGWSEWATVVPLEANRGFAAGTNAGIQHILEQRNRPDFIWMLNPDTAARSGAVEALVRVLGAHPDVGIAGSRLEDPDGTPQRSACRFPSVLGELEGGLRFGPVTWLLGPWVVAPPIPNESGPVDWVGGASFLVRRAVLESVGLLDEDYFLYFEEVDYCRRARRAGWSCWYVPDSRVVHLVAQSTGVTHERRSDARVPTYWFCARRRYFERNHGWLYSRAADVAWAGGYALWRLRRRLQGKRDADPPGLLADFLRHNFLSRRTASAGAV